MKKLYTVIIILLSLQASATAPTLPASNLGFFQVDGGYFNLGWSPGNGTRRVIICKAGGPVTFVPQNGIDYTENTIFGSGQQVAPGEYVVYDNAFTSFFVTGLTPATQYFFAIFEYNGTGTTTEYLTSNFLTGSATTSATPTTQTSNASFTAITTNSVTANWNNGNGQRRLIVVRQGSAVNSDPVNSHQYSVNSTFGNGEQVGTGNFTVYASSGTSTVVTNLQPGTQYFFSFYEFNGSGQPQYKIPAHTASVTTRSIPTVPSSNIVITKTDGKELGISWTNGNGQRRIIVAKKGSAVTGIPANGTDYAANAIFGSGPQLNAGEFVVYDDNFNEATISGLEPATIYFFKIFEYDGTGTNTIYLTNLFAETSASTAVRPTVQSTNISATNITGTSLNLLLSAGNGRARLIIAKKNSAVNIAPQDFTAYTGNGDFGNGQDLGSGNFVIENSTDNVIGVSNLESNTTYHFAVYEFNGINQPLYLSPAAVFNATTLGAVPVVLKNFDATIFTTKVKLQWTTTSEINSDHFVIERSSDVIHFSEIATVASTGNNSLETNYSKEDAAPLPGKSFYRLKMVDKDGQTTYSAIRTIIFTSKIAASILENPVRNTLTLINVTTATTNSEWQLISAVGQVIKKGTLQNGTNKINVDLLAPGTYWIKMSNTRETLLFIKL
ncbi:MAG: T9SS type A sorting domain-containing protein [Ferruginibacter sp.]